MAVAPGICGRGGNAAWGGVGRPATAIAEPCKLCLKYRRNRNYSLESSMTSYKLTHLRQLEAESIHIIREVAAEFDNPVMLY